MAQHVAGLATLAPAAASRSRLRSLIIPREHGAWGMLLVPLATGAALATLQGGRVSNLPLLIVATLVIFWLRTPVESWLGTSPMRAQSAREKSAVGRVILLLSAVAALTLTALFWDGRNRELLLLGMIAGLAFGLQAFLKNLSRKTRMLAQFVGAMGLTSTAPAAFSVIVGHLGTPALLLWLINWLFAVGQIHFVQVRIHCGRALGLTQKLACAWALVMTQATVVVMLVGASLARIIPALALLAFAPTWVRGIAWFFTPPRPLVVRRLGWTELAHAITFGVILVAGFYLNR
ncbi:MAG TPA: YwiC-like family protein [Terriglobales bacterium]|nr:YwiC-like family protein [Terriglobales bacterium]